MVKERKEETEKIETKEIETKSEEAPLASKVKATPRIFPLVFISLVSAFIGALIASLFVPYLFGLNPWDLLANRYQKSSTQKTIISKKGTSIFSANTIAAAAQKLQPSVVNIRIKERPSNFFFGHESIESGEGSGVIFRSDGYILTNNHVVAEADEIWVTIGDEPDVKGKVIGKDPERDLAVVKVNKTNLPAAELGASANLQVGELAVAIGSPFGFQHTVTAGIISALHRDVKVATEFGETIYPDLIQTDAAINPGNSGGGLANEEGQIIGINTVIATAGGGSEGVGFAIPIDVAKEVASQLIEKGKASFPYAGITLQTIDENLAKKYGLSVKEGALVAQVAPDTPADKAGVKEGDVVISYEGKPIKNADDLVAAIRKGKVGEKVKLTYVRGKEKETVELTLAEKPRVFR